MAIEKSSRVWPYCFFLFKKGQGTTPHPYVLGTGPINQLQFLLSAELLDGILPFHGLSLCLIGLIVNQRYRPPAPRIFRAKPRVVSLQSFFQINRPAGIQGAVSASYDIGISHASFVLPFRYTDCSQIKDLRLSHKYRNFLQFPNIIHIILYGAVRCEFATAGSV